MDSLGLTVQPEKSVLVPTQQIVFLGFLLCSVTMTVRLTPERSQEIIEFHLPYNFLMGLTEMTQQLRFEN